MQHVATQRAPDLSGFFELGSLGALDGREDDLLAMVEVGIGVLDARHFFARNGVAGHEAAHMRTQHTAGRVDHIALG